MHKIFISGRLGQDPEVFNFENGGSVTTFSIASQESKKEGDSWVKYPEWFTVKAFGKQGENVARYLTKGAGASVTGKLVSREYEGKKYYDLVADSVEFHGKQEAGESKPQAEVYDPPIQDSELADPGSKLEDSDIPF